MTLRPTALLANADRAVGGERGVDTEETVTGTVAERFGEPVRTRTVDDAETLGGGVETE